MTIGCGGMRDEEFLGGASCCDGGRGIGEEDEGDGNLGVDDLMEHKESGSSSPLLECLPSQGPPHSRNTRVPRPVGT